MSVADVRGELLAMIERRAGDVVSDGGEAMAPAEATHDESANGAGEMPPVMLPPDASPVGKAAKPPTAAKARKGA